MWIEIERAIEVIKDDKRYKAIKIGNTTGMYRGWQIKKSHFAFIEVFIDLDLTNDIAECKKSIERMEKNLQLLKHHDYLTTNN